MEVKKLRSIFMRYIFAVAVGILFIIAINFGLYMLCVNTEVIIPVVNIENRITAATEKYRQMNCSMQPTFQTFVIMPFILLWEHLSMAPYQKKQLTHFGWRLSQMDRIGLPHIVFWLSTMEMKSFFYATA